MKQAFSTTDGITDLLYVATHLNICSVPESFVFIDEDDEKPLEVMAPIVVFGPESTYEFKDLFSRFYDLILETWSDGYTGAVSAEIKAAVLLQQTDYNIYLTQLSAWGQRDESRRIIAYRKYMAQLLIDACA